MENNNKRIEELQQLNSQLEKKISELENSQRKKNLLIFGINEDEREYGEETYSAVRTVCRELFEVDTDGHIEEVYRVGKGKFRPILVKFQNLRTKEMIMNRVKNSRGTKLRFVNDLSYEVRRRRKLLLPYLKTARSKGHFAIMIDDKLKINDKVYVLEYCEKNCDKPEFWTEIEQSQVNQGAVKRRFNERKNMHTSRQHARKNEKMQTTQNFNINERRDIQCRYLTPTSSTKQLTRINQGGKQNVRQIQNTADEGLGKQLEVSEVRSIDKTNGGNAGKDMIRTSEGMKRLPDISDCEDTIGRAVERLLAKKKSAKK